MMFDSWTWGDTLKLAHILVSIVGTAVVLYMGWRTRSKKVVEDLTRALNEGDSKLGAALEGHAIRVDTSLRDHSHRIAILETTVRHMPTHNDMTLMRHELAELNGTVSALNERSETTHEMVQSIQEHLLESKK